MGLKEFMQTKEFQEAAAISEEMERAFSPIEQKIIRFCKQLAQEAKSEAKP